jgi:hypothetical protein
MYSQSPGSITLDKKLKIYSVSPVVVATGKVACRCRVAGSRIDFCRLHEQAEALLSACEYLRQILSTVKFANSEDENLIWKVVLPYLDDAIRHSQP